MSYLGKGRTVPESQQLLEAHWDDLARRSDRDNRPYFSAFYPQEDLQAAERIAAANGVTCTAWGGTEGTARVMFGFALEWSVPEFPQFPLTCLTFRWRGAENPGHRDFLGALMGCDLARETVGDILIADGIAQVFVCVPAASVILQELHQIGRVGVTVTEDDPVCLSAETAYLLIEGSVASLRADAITALVTKQSREKAVLLIRQGRLTCRHAVINAPAAPLQVGDVFSIRGYGKFRLAEDGGLTRKGRHHITIQKYQ